MEENVVDTGFEKFLVKFKKSLKRIIESNPLNKVIVVIEKSFIKIFVYESYEKASLRRVFRNNHSTRLVSHFVMNGFTEPHEDDLPFNFEYKPSSCIYIITSKELNKL